MIFLPTDAFPTETGLLRALSGTGDSVALYPGSFTLSYCTYFPLESSTKSDDSELTCFIIKMDNYLKFFNYNTTDLN